MPGSGKYLYVDRDERSLGENASPIPTTLSPGGISDNRQVLMASASNDSYLGMDNDPSMHLWNSSPSFESQHPSTHNVVSRVLPSARYGPQQPPFPPHHPPQPGYPYMMHHPLTSPVPGYLVQYPSPYGYGTPYWIPPPPPPPMVEYITEIQNEDVLCGRGGATNSHRGNKKFRELVKQYQDEYLEAKKRDKPAVASVIVDLIRKRGGRFLRRCGADVEGNVLFVEIGDERAREKTCQALREGAPELRRRKKANSSDEDDSKLSPSSRNTLSGDSGVETSDTTQLEHPSYTQREVTVMNDMYAVDNGSSDHNVIMISPAPNLMQGRSFSPISLGQLSSADRDMYLQDFWPPACEAHCGVDPSENNETGTIAKVGI